MRKLALLLFLTLMLAGCGAKAAPAAEETERPAPAVTAPVPAEKEEAEMQMRIGDTPVSVLWEENEAVQALAELVKAEPLRVEMSMYGGFEQVGSLGKTLPRSDAQTSTASGDIVLYSGDQIVVFYGSNSWAYTRLGHITDKSAAELTALLGTTDVTITIEMGR